MPPSEDRRYRRVLIAGVPFALVVSALADAGEWSVGWIWLALLTYLAVAMIYVHRERPAEREERERYARERGLPYPVLPRKRLPR
jgi:hypothetical protein